jgi:hypothetical protein
MNANKDDGFNLLPQKLQEVLYTVPSKEKDPLRQSTSSFSGENPDNFGQSETKLLRLGHHQFQSIPAMMKTLSQCHPHQRKVWHWRRMSAFLCQKCSVSIHLLISETMGSNLCFFALKAFHNLPLMQER